MASEDWFRRDSYLPILTSALIDTDMLLKCVQQTDSKRPPKPCRVLLDRQQGRPALQRSIASSDQVVVPDADPLPRPLSPSTRDFHRSCRWNEKMGKFFRRLQLSSERSMPTEEKGLRKLLGDV